MKMTTGYPRPRKYIKKIKVTKTYANNDYSNWDDKTYPIPFSALMNEVGKIANGRLIKCRQGRLCIVCGVVVEDARPWAYTWMGDHMVSDSGPFHEKCVVLTKKMCPVVSNNPDSFRFLRVSWRALERRVLPESQRKDYRTKLAARKLAPDYKKW